MIYIANGAASAQREAEDVVKMATDTLVVGSGPVVSLRDKDALAIWNKNDEARIAVAEALGLKLHWLLEQNAPTAWINLLGLSLAGSELDLRYRHAVCNALADIVRDTVIIHGWRQWRLGEDHPATEEALAWLDAASALQKLFDWQKKGNKDERDYPDVDLPEFELAPSWMYLTGPPNRPKSRERPWEPFIVHGARWTHHEF
jgi:hypothetical protein